LRLRVWGQVNIAANLRVSREGEIYITKVGAIHVAGLPFGQLSDHVRSAMERVYRNFDLSIEMGQIHSVQIYVTGFARNPGEYAVNAISTLVDAIFVAGGPSSVGSMRHVLLRRKGTVVSDFDLYSLLIHGDKTGDAQLQPGDILFIPPAGPQVAVLGSVRQPAIYELRGDESISRMLDAAGGRTAVASGTRISLERIEDHSHRRAIDLTLDETGLATGLRDGDIVRIESISSKYQQTVTLRGAVATPGHFAWHEGMRLSQLLPDRESLVKREYWWERTQLGVPGPEFAAMRSSSTALSDPAFNSMLSPSETRPGSGEARPVIVERSAHQTNWNYAVVERLNRETMKTSLLPFNLGKLVLEHDGSADMALEPGDVITIFSESDIRVPAQEETRYVTLEGEFVHPGIYSVTPTETLRMLIQRAGGLTPDAYLYSATFTRKSTRELEAEHLRELTDEMEHQLIRKAMVSVGGDANSQAAGLNRELLVLLRNVHATGRIVLDFELSKDAAPEFPELHLEDGDRLLVPHRPDTVQVLGAVFNPHAFVYRDGANAEDFVKMAGGPKRDADKKHMYVLRANGTVSDHVGASMFADNLKHVKLRPGDSVIVPEKELRLSSLAEVLAWSQAVSQASVTGLAVTSMAR
jgi:protein involved in polysaccharide export with SLBB domain